MNPTPASSVAVNTILQEPPSTGILSVLLKVHTATCPLDKIIFGFYLLSTCSGGEGLFHERDCRPGPALPIGSLKSSSCD